MNSKEIPPSPESGAAPHLSHGNGKNLKSAESADRHQVLGALKLAREALNNLSKLAYANRYGADAVFELTCDACKEYGYILAQFPEMEDAFRNRYGYAPAISAEKPNNLNAGFRKIALTGRKLRNLSPVNLRVENEGVSPASYFEYHLRIFVEAAFPDERREGPMGLVGRIAVPEIYTRDLSQTQNPRDWTAAFLKWISVEHAHLLDENVSTDCVSETSTTKGIFIRHINDLRFTEEGKLRPTSKDQNSMGALREQTRMRFRAILGSRKSDKP